MINPQSPLKAIERAIDVINVYPMKSNNCLICIIVLTFSAKQYLFWIDN